MKRLLLVSLIAALLAALAVMTGCTTKGTEAPNKFVGDTTSSQFQTASVVFDTAMNVGMGQFLGTMDIAGIASSSSGAPADQSLNPGVVEVPVFHPTSKYWYLIRSGVEYVHSQTEMDSIVDSVSWTAIDSLQFRHGDSAVFHPDSALWTELRSGCSFVAHSQTKDDSISSHNSFAVVGLPGALWARGDVVVNGEGVTHGVLTQIRPKEDTATICEMQISLTGAWTDLHANLEAVSNHSSCPTSGVISQTGTLSVACAKGMDSLAFSGMWSGSLTYADGQVTVVYENPSTRWTATRSCPEAHPITTSSDILRIRPR
jgi:hypothetical protein